MINKLYNLSTDNTFGTLQVKNIYTLTFVCICVFNNCVTCFPWVHRIVCILFGTSHPLKSILFSVTSHTVEAFLSEWQKHGRNFIKAIFNLCWCWAIPLNSVRLLCRVRLKSVESKLWKTTVLYNFDRIYTIFLIG